MKIEPFCGWGDGPDVGINLTRTEAESHAFVDPLFWAVDLTVDEAEKLAMELMLCAKNARALQKEWEMHVTYIGGPDADV